MWLSSVVVVVGHQTLPLPPAPPRKRKIAVVVVAAVVVVVVLPREVVDNSVSSCAGDPCHDPRDRRLRHANDGTPLVAVVVARPFPFVLAATGLPFVGRSNQPCRHHCAFYCVSCRRDRDEWMAQLSWSSFGRVVRRDLHPTEPSIRHVQIWKSLTYC